MLSALRCRAVNEECYTYNECNVYASLGASKPVFGIEYCDTTPRSPGSRNPSYIPKVNNN